MSDDDATAPADQPAAPRSRRIVALVLGWVLLVPSAVHLAMNPSALGPLWQTSTTLACLGLLAGVTLIAWTRSTRSAG